MGSNNQAASVSMMVGDNQPDFPQSADRTAIMGGAIITDIGNINIFSNSAYTRKSQPVTPETRHQSAYGSNYGDSFLFERIWVQPLLIAVGFITEDTDWTITVWNASRFDASSVTSILTYNPDGTQITYDALPNTLQIFGDVTYPLEVFNAGPPLQDSTYKFTVAGLDYETDITGIRVLPFDPDPNWNTGITLTYQFQSTIFTSGRLNEQRRPLSQDSWLSIGINADVAKDRFRSVFNLLSYGKDKVFGVPIYNEKINPVSCAQGSTFIYTDDDLNLFYNLNNRADFIILVDHINGLAEVKEVSSIEEGLIILDQPISKDFQQSTTYVYPNLFCYLKTFRSTNITDDFTEFSVDFEEYKS